MPRFAKHRLRQYLEQGDPNQIDYAKNRQIGSTTAIALETIAHAIRNPNIPVLIVNHEPTNKQCDLLLAEKIIEFIDVMGLNDMKVKKQGNLTLTFTGVVELTDDEVELAKCLVNGTTLARVISKIY